jgi:hypothetical protein
MHELELTVRELLAAAQQDRKTKLGAVNVDRLRPFYEPVDAPPAPGPVSDAGQEGEHEVELLLNRKTSRGVTRYLVRWHGHTSADDEWLRAEDLLRCPEKVAEYEASLAARHGGTATMPAPLATAPVLPAQLLPPAGFRLATAAELRVGPALVRAAVLYWWPLDGWVPQQGRVRRVCKRAGFSHAGVVGYAASSSPSRSARWRLTRCLILRRTGRRAVGISWWL